MSNTTFDAKEAVKLMLDGQTVRLGGYPNSIFKILDFSLNFEVINDDLQNPSGQLRFDISNFLYVFRDDVFETQNLVEWYRPKFTWQENSPNNAPSEWQEDKDFYPTKKAFLDSYDKKGIHEIKVLKWEIEYFPPMYEECE